MMNENRARLLRPPSKMWLVLSAVLLLAGLGFLGAFGYAQYQYYKSGSLYTELRQVAVSAVSETEQTEQIDFTALQEINPDVAAWIEIPGLDLSLPVVQAQDNQTYLHRSFDGSESPAGCLFFAAPTGGDADLYRVIYGHNLHNGGMFSGLLCYADVEFCREHPTFTLYTPEGAQTWRIFSAHTATDATDLYRTNRTPGDDYDSFLQELQAMSEYDTGVDLPGRAQVLTLSTCWSPYASGLERFVVHAYRESSVIQQER